MGNCQAAEVATVVVQHPGDGKVERIYWSVNASEVMSSNPGYYVALVVESSGVPRHQTSKNHLKLLRPEDTMHIGHVYRLISFEDVIKEFAAKKSAKLGKLLKGSGVLNGDNNKNLSACGTNPDNAQMEGNNKEEVSVSRNVGRHSGVGQWRPVLNTIAEF
ncbi:hypothetical protein RND81_13G188500 [Saponaria officinalis]|uniref:DUF4228 domain-containing protein n=1 Tax=Saponaria officinalis TaxID=3572 RepID=A0AAW1H1G6_SAPOF